MFVVRRPKVSITKRWETLVRSYVFVRHRRSQCLQAMRSMRTKRFVESLKDNLQLQLENAIFQNKPFPCTQVTCSQLREHIESKFDHRMGWHNASEWHVGFVVPRCAFLASEQERAFHVSNLVPKWGPFRL